ncbi:MAG: helix-turn-helix transcriptional regulator [Streptosporangiaceae bacterium]
MQESITTTGEVSPAAAARPTATGDSPYLTIDDLAERYQVPVATVRYWRLQGVGPKAVKIGRFVRYPLASVLAFERQLHAAAR